jgi:hypothetical protein
LSRGSLHAGRADHGQTRPARLGTAYTSAPTAVAYHQQEYAQGDAEHGPAFGEGATPPLQDVEDADDEGRRDDPGEEQGDEAGPIHGVRLCQDRPDERDAVQDHRH